MNLLSNLILGSNGFSGLHLFRQAVAKRFSRLRILRPIAIWINPFLTPSDRGLYKYASISKKDLLRSSINLYEEGRTGGDSFHREGNLVCVSFVYTRASRQSVIPRLKKGNLLSEVIPGFPYNYRSEDEYLNNYKDSHLALSPKKAGWETMRTLEIIFSGSFPLIANVQSSCPHSLVFHPKKIYEEGYRELVERCRIPSPMTMENLQKHALSMLVPEKLAETVSEALAEELENIVIHSMTRMDLATYLEAGFCTGLRNLIGHVKITRYPKYYTSPELGSAPLHGLGFALTGIFRSSEVQKVHLDALDNKTTLILTHVERLSKEQVLNDLSKLSQKFEKISILFDGDLHPPSWLISCMQEMGGLIFTRSFLCRCAN